MLFSIIIPVYNTKKYLRECIQSIVRQTFRDYEIILIDDGSTDGSSELCDELSGDKVRVFHIKNQGVANARNIGIDAASGEYIWFVDSDDTIIDSSLTILRDLIQEKEPDFISFGINRILLNGDKELSRKRIYYNEAFYESNKEAFCFFQTNDLLDLVADKVCRRDIINQINARFNQEDVPTEDHIFWLNIYPHLGTIAVIDQCLYNYFIRDGVSSTRKLRYNKFPAYAHSLKLMINLSNEYGVMPSMEDYLHKLYCYYILWEFEILNHPDCKFGLMKRYRYFREVFRSNSFEEKFCKDALDYYLTTNEIPKIRCEAGVLRSIIDHQYLYPACISLIMNLWGRKKRRR